MSKRLDDDEDTGHPPREAAVSTHMYNPRDHKSILHSEQSSNVVVYERGDGQSDRPKRAATF